MNREDLLKLDPETLVDTLLSERADAEQKKSAERDKKRLKLVNIENMPHGELKANKADLIEAAKLEPVSELAERFVSARIDAKQRDKRMGEMGEEITTLTASLDAAVKAGEVLAEKLAASEKEAFDLRGEANLLEARANAAEHKLSAAEAEIAELKKPAEGDKQ